MFPNISDEKNSRGFFFTKAFPYVGHQSRVYSLSMENRLSFTLSVKCCVANEEFLPENGSKKDMYAIL
jgi:hypothetical protein